MGGVCSGIRLGVLVAIVILSFDVGVSVADEAQKAGPSAGPVNVDSLDLHPLARLNTKSPRATIKNFLETMDRAYGIQMKAGYRSREAGEFLERAEICFDLSKVLLTLLQIVGIEACSFLQGNPRSDRNTAPYEEIPDFRTMESNRWSRWTIPARKLLTSQFVHHILTERK